MKTNRFYFVFLILFTCISLLSSCNKQENSTANAQSAEIKELASKLEAIELKVEELESKLSEFEQKLEAKQTETTAKKTEENETSKYITHEHIQTLDFSYGAFGVTVLKSVKGTEVLYAVQTGDKIKTSKLLEKQDEQEAFIQVTIPTGETGYIKIRNPYYNGKFAHIETIKVDGKDVKLLKLEGDFGVSEMAVIKSLPSEQAESLHELTHAEGGAYHKVFAITDDFKWVKVQVGDYLGWIYAKDLYLDRGGPTIFTPTVSVDWELIDSNLI